MGATFWSEVVPMMRKALLTLLVAVVVFAAAPVYADPATYNGFPVVSVQVNGKSLQSEVPPIIMDGRTLVPLRAAAEALGATVGYDAGTSTVSIDGGGRAPSPVLTKDAFNRIISAQVSLSLATGDGYLRALDANAAGTLSNQDMAAATLRAKQDHEGLLAAVARLVPPSDAHQVRLYALQAFQAEIMALDTAYMAFAGADARTRTDNYAIATALSAQATSYANRFTAALNQWRLSNGL